MRCQYCRRCLLRIFVCILTLFYSSKHNWPNEHPFLYFPRGRLSLSYFPQVYPCLDWLSPASKDTALIFLLITRDIKLSRRIYIPLSLKHKKIKSPFFTIFAECLLYKTPFTFLYMFNKPNKNDKH